MTQTEQLMSDLRDAIRAELIEEIRTYWDANRDAYEDADDAVGDIIITLEQR